MARPSYPSDKQSQFMVRLPDGMRERLKHSATENKRSMNAEIVKRLEDTYELVQTYFDFESGTSKIKPPESWYRNQAYQSMDEDELTKMVIERTEELASAVDALKTHREKNGKY